jgi:hypothetical protein
MARKDCHQHRQHNVAVAYSVANGTNTVVVDVESTPASWGSTYRCCTPAAVNSRCRDCAASDAARERQPSTRQQTIARQSTSAIRSIPEHDRLHLVPLCPVYPAACQLVALPTAHHEKCSRLRRRTPTTQLPPPSRTNEQRSMAR